MNKLETRIQIDDNRILIYKITEWYPKPTYIITEGFLENGNVKKTYTLSQWDDYGLNGWVNEDKNINKISFEFNIGHPLYIPLFHLLNYDDELIIDDDTVENNKKYISIYKKNNTIFIDFVDNVNYDNHMNLTEKFHVFIKNIGFDGRSKIDQFQKDTKKRLYIFFNEIYEVLINDFNQISIEEYLINNYPNYELKKVFKKKIM